MQQLTDGGEGHGQVGRGPLTRARADKECSALYEGNLVEKQPSPSMFKRIVQSTMYGSFLWLKETQLVQYLLAGNVRDTS